MDLFNGFDIDYNTDININVVNSIMRNTRYGMETEHIKGGYEPQYNWIYRIKKIIFNDPCVILIDSLGSKTIVRIQENEQYDKVFGYYLVLAKYLSTNATYSELLAHIYEDENKYHEQKLNVLESFLMGKLGVKLCREIVFEKAVDILKIVHENPKNYTIDFKEVLNA